MSRTARRGGSETDPERSRLAVRCSLRFHDGGTDDTLARLRNLELSPNRAERRGRRLQRSRLCAIAPQISSVKVLAGRQRVAISGQFRGANDTSATGQNDHERRSVWSHRLRSKGGRTRAFLAPRAHRLEGYDGLADETERRRPPRRVKPGDSWRDTWSASLRRPIVKRSGRPVARWLSTHLVRHPWPSGLRFRLDLY